MPPPATSRAVFLASCRDQRGVVATFAKFIYEHNGNITDADQHRDPETDTFCARFEWDLAGFALARQELTTRLKPLAAAFGMQWSLHFSDERPRAAVWVSRQEHCLIDLLARQRSHDLPIDIPLVIGNHPELASTAAQFGIPFLHLEVRPETKLAEEARALAAMRTLGIDLVVLAKYMQILSPDFLRVFPAVINIHHSFLPAFPGGSPYQQAYSRGVKIIGATAHYVTEQLDEGPIIEQDVERISHRDSVADLVRKGKDLEKIVLARAVYDHAERRVLVYGNKTVVFS